VRPSVLRLPPMLRISKKADYAVFLLGCIARQGAYPGGSAPDAVVSAQEIAKLASLNKSVVANLLKEFSRAGILESVRGLKGGYRLVRPPQEVDLREILEVIEGPFQLVDCVSAGHQPPATKPSLLALSPSQSSSSHSSSSHTSSSQGTASPGTSSGSESACGLIGFCPTKTPMRIVHDRINDMFRSIRLDELSGLHTHAAGHAGSHR